MSCLNGEIRPHNERILEKNQDCQEVEEVKPPDNQENQTDTEDSVHDTGKKHHNNEEIVEQSTNHTDKSYIDYQSDSDISSNNELELIKKELLDLTESSVASEESVCPECNFAFSTEENLKIHRENVHSKLDQKNAIEKGSSEKSHSNKIPKKANNVKPVHKKAKSHICEECGTAFSKKYLKMHKASVHKMELGMRKLKCDKCSFETFNSAKLKLHIASVHKIDIGLKKLKCDKCSYESFSNANFKVHRASVHKIDMGLKKLKCDKCSFESLYSSKLKVHRASVHRIELGIKKLECDKCSYESFNSTKLKVHRASVHKINVGLKM